jgi:chromosomal replication initiation ATPase DnaA
MKGSTVETNMSAPLMRLVEAIEQAAGQYYRLVIVAGVPGSGKTAMTQSLATAHGYPLINVNLELSKRLLDLTRVQRSRQVERLLKEVIASVTGDVVILDNIELLFDTALELEPLRLLQGASRNRTIVATWNGSFNNGTLAYAEPGHPEFVQFKQTEAIVVLASTSETN